MDLKVENILIQSVKDKCWKIFVADLGSSLRLCDTSLMEMTYSSWCELGTIMYHSPELILHLSQCVSDRWDVWSYACILVEMLIGFPLFYGFDHFDMMSLIGQCPKYLLEVSPLRKQYYVSDGFEDVLQVEFKKRVPQQIAWKGIEHLKQSLACVIDLPVFSKPSESQKASNTISNANEHATTPPNSNSNSNNTNTNSNPSPADNTDINLKQKPEDHPLNEGTKTTAEPSLETQDKEKEEKGQQDESDSSKNCTQTVPSSELDKESIQTEALDHFIDLIKNSFMNPRNLFSCVVCAYDVLSVFVFFFFFFFCAYFLFLFYCCYHSPLSLDFLLFPFFFFFFPLCETDK
ncbi:hypothetical protein RFI_27832 [Reticulomyxa filosa]|uniref:Protein kinase domain-containing protein n=1 Tax=Reticulomyxa filosa TaxID=46433 RepID=X6M7C0_RETFI|nr:hypothetical protein RFI_27832 [Reticulomyxa filosa]|eukprot:ETO09546.1 hypothetical protein RFI_27832 [Reticulomyxa filosa]